MGLLSVKHLLGIKYLKPEDIELIFQYASSFKEVLQRPIKKVPSLMDITIANVFFENSTRTKISFELAEKRLSADIVNFSVSNSSAKKGESLIDTINNISAMKVDMMVIRHPNSGACNMIAEKAKHNPVIINAGDGTNEHPTQALLDCFSIKEKLGHIKGKKVAIVGDILHSRVALSDILILKHLNAEVKTCAPYSLVPNNIELLGVQHESNLEKALEWCDVAIFLRVQNERLNDIPFPSTRDYSMRYGLSKEAYDKLNKKILIMHPGPINRGVEIDSSIADSEDSIILNQVENGVAIRMAVIYLLAGRNEKIQ